MSSWAEDDQPREKLKQNGRTYLSNAELIAILIRSGSIHKSALQISKEILRDHGNCIDRLSKLDINDLCEYKGVGLTKAVSIIAALELGRRRKPIEVEKAKIQSSDDAYAVLGQLLGDLPHEEFWVIALNRRNQIQKKILVSRGGVSGTLVDLKLVFKPALQLLSSAIILAHNHPSGNLYPSKADKKLTKRIVEAGKLLDIEVLDHLIIGNQSFYSFADEGII